MGKSLDKFRLGRRACNPDQIVVESGINLLKRPEEFQSKEAGITNDFLPEYFGCDGGSLVWHQAGGGRRGSRNRELHNLILAQHVGGRNARTI